MHFNNNEDNIPQNSNYDRLFEIRLEMEMLRKISLGKCSSIDEQICATKNTAMFEKKYMPNKPHEVINYLSYMVFQAI